MGASAEVAGGRWVAGSAGLAVAAMTSSAFDSILKSTRLTLSRVWLRLLGFIYWDLQNFAKHLQGEVIVCPRLGHFGTCSPLILFP